MKPMLNGVKTTFRCTSILIYVRLPCKDNWLNVTKKITYVGRLACNRFVVYVLRVYSLFFTNFYNNASATPNTTMLELLGLALFTPGILPKSLARWLKDKILRYESQTHLENWSSWLPMARKDQPMETRKIQLFKERVILDMFKGGKRVKNTFEQVRTARSWYRWIEDKRKRRQRHRWNTRELPLANLGSPRRNVDWIKIF